MPKMHVSVCVFFFLLAETTVTAELQCPGKLVPLPLYKCKNLQADRANGCYKWAHCPHVIGNAEHTCVIETEKCPSMDQMGTSTICPFVIREDTLSVGCSNGTEFSSVPYTSYQVVTYTYKCQMTVPNAHINCWCHGRRWTNNLDCTRRASIGGFLPPVACVSTGENPSPIACSIQIADMSSAPTWSAIHKKGTKVAAGLNSCTKVLERKTHANGKPNVAFIESGPDVWCCVALSSEPCNHICYHNGQKKHEVCDSSRNYCYYAMDPSDVSAFESGCSDGTGKPTVLAKTQADVKCWGKQIANHYICVQHKDHSGAATIDSFANRHNLLPNDDESAKKLIKDMMDGCAKALLTTVDYAKCIHLPLLNKGKPEGVYCAIATKTDSCSDSNENLQGQKSVCWQYNVTDRATMQSAAKLYLGATVCSDEKPCALLMNEQLSKFASGCHGLSEPGLNFQHTLTDGNPLELVKHVKKCASNSASDQHYCLRQNGDTACIQLFDGSAVQIGCKQKVENLVPNLDVNTGKKCLDDVGYAIDQQSGKFIKWLCCAYGTCDDTDKLTNSGHPCPQGKSVPFDKHNLCESIPPATSTNYEKYDQGSKYVICQPDDMCVQSITMDGSSSAVRLVTGCNSTLQYLAIDKVPDACKKYANVLQAVPKWSGGLPSASSASIDEPLRKLAACVSDHEQLQCDSTTGTVPTDTTETGTTSTETPPTTTPDSAHCHVDHFVMTAVCLAAMFFLAYV